MNKIKSMLFFGLILTLAACDVAVHSEYSIRDIEDVIATGKPLQVSSDFQIQMGSPKTCQEQSEKIVQLLSSFIKIDSKECKKNGMDDYLNVHTYLVLMSDTEFEAGTIGRPPIGFVTHTASYLSPKNNTNVTVNNLVLYIDKNTFDTMNTTLKGSNPMSPDFKIHKIVFDLANDTSYNKQYLIATDSYLNGEPKLNGMIGDLESRKKVNIQLNQTFIDFVLANQAGRIMSVADDMRSYFD